MSQRSFPAGPQLISEALRPTEEVPLCLVLVPLLKEEGQRVMKSGRCCGESFQGFLRKKML